MNQATRANTTFIHLAALIAAVSAMPAVQADNEIPFAEAELFFELNNTGGDLGIHSSIDGDAWKRLVKTVIQELMYRAARLIATGRRLKLRFSRHCAGYRAFDGVYQRLVDG